MIGFITIGQTPRDDLLLPYLEILGRIDYCMIGVLDGLNEEDIPPSEGMYPLVTKLSNGKLIQVEKEFLQRRMEHVINSLEQSGVTAIVLLCAGDFEVQSNVPILQPNLLAPFYMKQFTSKDTIGTIIPVESQKKAACVKWEKYGFKCNTLTIPMVAASLNEEWSTWIKDNSFDTILFDCTGYQPNLIRAFKGLTKKKVYGTDEILLSTLKTLLSL